MRCLLHLLPTQTRNPHYVSWRLQGLPRTLHRTQAVDAAHLMVSAPDMAPRWTMTRALYLAILTFGWRVRRPPMPRALRCLVPRVRHQRGAGGLMPLQPHHLRVVRLFVPQPLRASLNMPEAWMTQWFGLPVLWPPSAVAKVALPAQRSCAGHLPILHLMLAYERSPCLNSVARNYYLAIQQRARRRCLSSRRPIHRSQCRVTPLMPLWRQHEEPAIPCSLPAFLPLQSRGSRITPTMQRGESSSLRSFSQATQRWKHANHPHVARRLHLMGLIVPIAPE